MCQVYTSMSNMWVNKDNKSVRFTNVRIKPVKLIF